MADLTQNFNYLQPTSFKLIIDRKNYPNLEFFCQGFTHPGMTMNSVEVPYQRITSVPFIGDKLTFNEMQANILLDEDDERKLKYRDAILKFCNDTYGENQIVRKIMIRK